MRISSRAARGPMSGPAPALLTTLLLTSVVGCGFRSTGQAPSAQRPESESSSGIRSSSESGSSAEVAAAETPQEPAAPLQKRERAGTIHRITMSDKNCLRFDPQWTTVLVGESITWRSELKTPVTIYVSPGVFSKISFRVRPGATVSSGPARSAGRYAFWTEPTACQDMPLGVLLAAPGVRVQERLYASAETR